MAAEVLADIDGWFELNIYAPLREASDPARAIAPDDASDPTLAISIDATSGSTVMRIRLTKIVPTGAATATIVAAAGDVLPERAKPTRNPPTRPISTRVVNDTRES